MAFMDKLPAGTVTSVELSIDLDESPNVYLWPESAKVPDFWILDFRLNHNPTDSVRSEIHMVGSLAQLRQLHRDFGAQLDEAEREYPVKEVGSG